MGKKGIRKRIAERLSCDADGAEEPPSPPSPPSLPSVPPVPKRRGGVTQRIAHSALNASAVTAPAAHRGGVRRRIEGQAAVSHFHISPLQSYVSKVEKYKVIRYV
jgi:hypothetical protein